MRYLRLESRMYESTIGLPVVNPLRLVEVPITSFLVGAVRKARLSSTDMTDFVLAVFLTSGSLTSTTHLPREFFRILVVFATGAGGLMT